jgi:uncharacterized membrane protein YdjX (TVP38/TMEM64 family)
MRGFPRFITAGARNWRRVIFAFVAFGGVGLALVVAAPALGLKGSGEIARWLSVSQGPWALPAVVAAFAALAFIGVPQVALIAAAVVVLGPEKGALYSWIGTLVSALVGFGVGRLLGMTALGENQGPRLQSFMTALARNGFISSLLVRLAPFAPFVLINIAAGVTPMRLVDFTAGTAIGIIPKIVLTAFAGGSILLALKGGGPAPVALAAMAILLLLAAAVAAQRWISGRRA